jgi:hypothetical protein
MACIITDKLRIKAAQDLRENYSETDNNTYFFIGKSSPWPVESLPPTPEDTYDLFVKVWDDILAMKKVTIADVKHALIHAKYDVSGNTVYFPYRSDDKDLLRHPTVADASLVSPKLPGAIYCVTDTFDVYKCLDNNNNSSSTVKPTGVTPGPFTLSDGYKWIYMYTIPGADIFNFVSDKWITVSTLSADDGSAQWDAQVAAIDGTIDAVFVSSSGAGYINTITGSLASATSTTVDISGSGTLNSSHIGASVYIEGVGISAGQVRVIVSISGTIATLSTPFLNIPPNGQAFSILPSIRFDVVERENVLSGDLAAVFKPVVTSGQITKVNVLERGTKYRLATLSVVGCGGTGATVFPAIAPKKGHGADALFELGGFYLIHSIRLQFNEGAGDFPTTNDLRRMGLFRDVLTAPGVLATASTARAQKAFTLTGLVGSFLPDETIISSSGSQAFAIEHDVANNRLVFFQDSLSGFKDFSVSETLTGGISGAVATISAINPAEVLKYSGELIHIENRGPLSRSPSQNENIKLVIYF